MSKLNAKDIEEQAKKNAAEKKKLEKELAKLNKEIKDVRTKLSERFLDKATLKSDPLFEQLKERCKAENNASQEVVLRFRIDMKMPYVEFVDDYASIKFVLQDVQGMTKSDALFLLDYLSEGLTEDDGMFEVLSCFAPLVRIMKNNTKFYHEMLQKLAKKYHEDVDNVEEIVLDIMDGF